MPNVKTSHHVSWKKYINEGFQHVFKSFYDCYIIWKQLFSCLNGLFLKWIQLFALSKSMYNNKFIKMGFIICFPKTRHVLHTIVHFSVSTIFYQFYKLLLHIITHNYYLHYIQCLVLFMSLFSKIWAIWRLILDGSIFHIDGRSFGNGKRATPCKTRILIHSSLLFNDLYIMSCLSVQLKNETSVPHRW